jgi:DnaJ family protein C protein 16
MYFIFSYMELNEESTQNFRERFGVPSNLDSMLLFQEDKDRPAARISMQDLPYTTLNDIINSNKWLQLPRLSSQKILEELCPPESSKARRVLCAILVTEDREEDDEVRAQLRKFALESKISRDRVTFAYIYKEKQAEFLTALSKGTLPFLFFLNLTFI